MLSFQTEKSRAGNDFFDVKVKASETETVTIIMKNTNRSITHPYLLELKESQATFKNLSPASSGVFFFNSFKGSRIDKSSEVSFTFTNSTSSSTTQIKNHTTGCFDVVGCIKYLGEMTEIKSSHDEGKIHNLREAILFDATEIYRYQYGIL